MKKLFLLFFVLHFVSYGQKADGLEICFEVQKSLKGFAADKEADDALDEILAVIGAAKNFYLITCDEINNALALTYKGERFILYDKDFIDRINKATNDWSGKFILAHEVGHHINGHTRDFLIASVLDDQTKEKQREEELEADEFAGFIVAKLGAKYNQIKELINTIAPEKDDKYSTHPNRSKRLEAIKKGFDKGQGKAKSTISNNYIESLKTSNGYRYKTGGQSSWTFFEDYPHSRYKKEYADRPIDWKEIEKRFPEVSRWSSSVGKSIATNPVREIEITIKQEKLKFNNDEYSTRSSILKTHLPFKWIDILIDGNMGFIKYIHSDGVFIHPEKMTSFKNITNDIPRYSLIQGKVVYLIDDDIYGEFLIDFPDWSIDYRETIEIKKVFEKEYKTIDNPKYNKLLPVSDAQISWWDNTEDSCIKIKEFLNALKKGKKLYIKLKSTIRTMDENYQWSEWYDDYEILDHTYEFDLSGSSKALQLN
tara:strand:- start:42 stop:1487 length:1446 start_codon:yes stop_codon:yes gene_type:complete